MIHVYNRLNNIQDLMNNFITMENKILKGRNRVEKFMICSMENVNNIIREWI